MTQICVGAQELGISLTEAISGLKRKGLSYVDVSSQDVRLLSPNGTCATLKENGIAVESVFHLFAFDFIDSRRIEAFKEDIKRQIETCVALNGKFYMPVPVVNFPHKDRQVFLDTRKRFAEYLQNSLDIGKDYGVQTVIENYSDRKNPNARIEDIAYYLTELPNLKYVLDCGNFWFGGEDVLRATDLFKEKIVHVHLKDLLETKNGRLRIGGKRGESVCIGAGEIPTRQILQKLRGLGYNGGLTVEINHNENLITEIAESLENVKVML